MITNFCEDTMGKSSCGDKDGLKKGPWTAEEDQKLIDYIQKHGHGRWRILPKNAGVYLFFLYVYIFLLVTCFFSLSCLIYIDCDQNKGFSSFLFCLLSGLKRCGKSCRLRWTNYLRPDIKRGRFSYEEEETIIQLHGVLGNK